MKWIHQFEFFLFDFDGLLVNTEHLHFQAYINTMAQFGFHLDWTFAQFCELAHLNSTALKEGLYNQFPDLDPNWDGVYARKKHQYLELVATGKVELMKGVEPLLKNLKKASIRSCVVTNSPKEQTDLIRSFLKPLDLIPHWITREQYEKPKPHPEGYLKAMQLFKKPNDHVIGFEDSIRGLKALQQTPALPVLICPSHYLDLCHFYGRRPRDICSRGSYLKREGVKQPLPVLNNLSVRLQPNVQGQIDEAGGHKNDISRDYPLLEIGIENTVHFESFEDIPSNWNR